MQNDELKHICRDFIQDCNEHAAAHRMATALLQRLEAEEAGYVLVPREPTEEMQLAGHNVRTRHLDDGMCYAGTDEIYSAMLAAAPKPD